MYRVIKDGVSIGLTEKLTYITKARNGCFILCPEKEHRGVVHQGTPYHVIGRPPMDGAEDVMLEAVDGGSEIDKTASSIKEMDFKRGIETLTPNEMHTVKFIEPFKTTPVVTISSDSSAVTVSNVTETGFKVTSQANGTNKLRWIAMAM